MVGAVHAFIHPSIIKYIQYIFVDCCVVSYSKAVLGCDTLLRYNDHWIGQICSLNDFLESSEGVAL